MSRTRRQWVHELIEPGVKSSFAAGLFNQASAGCILVSVACVVFSTVPTLSRAVHDMLDDVEYVVGAFFVVEYALRHWAAGEHPLYHGLPAWQRSLRFGATPLMLLDALGLISFFLYVLAVDGHALILLFQILRFFRLARYSPALVTMGRVLVSEWRSLMATGMIGLGLLLVSATIMYLLENTAQPEKFASIPDAMWWAIVTLATVGYGDVAPITPLGKVAAAGVIVSGLVYFALPIAIIASAFVEEMRRRDFNINYSMVARVPLFAGLDAIAISELAGMLKARKVPRDATIVSKGDKGESMFFIAQGLVEVVVPDREIMLREGDFFGEMAVLGKMRRTATVIARQPCELLVLDASDLARLIEQNPAVEVALHDVMAQRQVMA